LVNTQEEMVRIYWVTKKFFIQVFFIELSNLLVQ
jgi:hypothetical protein